VKSPQKGKNWTITVLGYVNNNRIIEFNHKYPRLEVKSKDLYLIQKEKYLRINNVKNTFVLQKGYFHKCLSKGVAMRNLDKQVRTRKMLEYHHEHLNYR
jgi:hypothetical protein